ncbi:MAG: DNA repair protein RecO [Acetobacteraceae bacterium]|nr:DNA repair protein RecO [Acetobacteraceae bacterium]
MGLYRTEAIVLRAQPLGEADRLLTLLSREGGKVRAVARGARRARSRLMAGTQPFTHASLLLLKGRELDTVSQCEIRNAFGGIQADLERTAWASCAVELVDAALEETGGQEAGTGPGEVFSLLLSALGLLSRGEGSADAVWLAFALRLLSLLGYRPRLEACAACERTPAGDGEDSLYFSPALGGVLCERCRAQDPAATRLSRGGLMAARQLLEGDMARSGQVRLGPVLRGELEALLEGHLARHLDRRLRSLEFVRAIRTQSGGDGVGGAGKDRRRAQARGGELPGGEGGPGTVGR